MSKIMLRLLFMGGACAILLGATALKTVSAPLWIAGATSMVIAFVLSVVSMRSERSATLR